MLELKPSCWNPLHVPLVWLQNQIQNQTALSKDLLYPRQPRLPVPSAPFHVLQVLLYVTMLLPALPQPPVLPALLQLPSVLQVLLQALRRPPLSVPPMPMPVPPSLLLLLYVALLLQELLQALLPQTSLTLVAKGGTPSPLPFSLP